MKWLLVAVLASTAGCGAGKSLLTVEVTSDMPIDQIDHLRVELTDVRRNKTANEIDVAMGGQSIPPSVSFNIVLDAQVKGTVNVSITAIDSNNTVIGSGVQTATVTPSKTASVAVTLSPTGTGPGPNPIATSLEFVAQPTNALPDTTIAPAITVRIVDQNGMPMTDATSTITLAIGTNPNGGFLSGAISRAAVNGVATFDGLSINRWGSAYTLVATSSGLQSTASTTFDILRAPFFPIDSGLEGGVVNALVFAPSNPSIAYAAAKLGGMYKSTDGGSTWVAIASSLNFIFFNALSVSPTDPNDVYALSGTNVLEHSKDGGATWSADAVGLPATTGFGLVVDATNPGTIVVLSNSGAYKATDGIHFTAANAGLSDLHVYAVAAVPGDTTRILVLTPSGASRTTNGATLWETINNGLPPVATTILSNIAVDPNNANRHFMAIDDPSTGGIYRTDDGGANWSRLSLEPDLRGASVVVDPANSSSVWAGMVDGKVFHSTDGGATWGQSGASTLTQNPIYTIFARPSDHSAWASAAGTGLWSTTDAITWSHRAVGMHALQTTSIFVDPATPTHIFVGAVGNTIFRSTNSGTNWTESTVPVGAYSELAQWTQFVKDTTSGALYAANFILGTVKSTDGGLTWSATVTGIKGPDGFLAASQSPFTLWISRLGKLKRSTDGGSTWTTFSVGTATGWQPIAIDPTNADILFAAFAAKIYKSTNAQATTPIFTDVSTGLGTAQITSLFLDAQTPTTVYAADASGALWQSIAGGNWTTISTTSFAAIDGGFDPRMPTVAYVATGGGVLKSSDAGITFAPVASQRYRSAVAVAIDPVDEGTVYAAIEGFGVIKTTTAGK